jgi:aminocarboxymuconate-semialdehyde decarboxylase
MVQKTKESVTESPAVTAKRFYYDNVLFDSDSVKFLVNRFGADQVLVGSDYPFALGEKDPLGRLRNAGLDEKTVALIGSTNAKRFLGLPEAPR